MIALQVENVRDFMQKLLVGSVFDSFRVSEVNVTTFAAFSIDGQLHPEFFDPDEIGPQDETQAPWEDVRPFCLEIMKGRRLPISFRIVLQLPQTRIPGFLEENGLPLSPEDIFGLFMNIQYRNDILTVTTGTSMRVFSGNKDLDRAWDGHVRAFLASSGLD